MTSSPPQKPIALETRWRAASPELKAFIKRLTASLEAEEDGQGLRRRKRKAADKEKFERAVEAICCNFAAVAIAFGSDGRPALAVQLGAYASSNSMVYGAHFRLLLELMAGRGLITVSKGHRHSKHHRVLSTIRATPLYWEQAPLSANWDALSLEEHREVILVGKDSDGQKILPPSDWLEQANADMRRINEYLRLIPLAVAGREVLPPRDMPNRAAIILATPHHRTVRRVFKGSIELGGRLYDGFWETMRREDRYPLLTINGEPVVNVDYGQLFLRLAYALSKQTPPPGDLYDLTGSDHERADWQTLRFGRKKMLTAMFSAKRTLKQWPGDWAEIRKCFPPGTKPRHVAAGLRERHSAIAADWLECGRGLELHRLESDILIAVMLRLIDLRISALPLHDSVLVARSDGEAARHVMFEEALRITGASIPVGISAGE